jgi:hypothetical protein
VSTSGGASQLIWPVWDQLANGNVTTPRNIVNDSNSFINPIVSGTEYFVTFLAGESVDVGHIGIRLGSVVAAAITLARVGLYSVDASLNKHLIASSANMAMPGAAFGILNPAMTVPAMTTEGNLYAVGMIQVGTTCASFLGSGIQFSTQGVHIAESLAGQTDLVTTPTGLTVVNYAPYFELTP